MPNLFHGNNQGISSSEILAVLNFDPSLNTAKEWEISATQPNLWVVEPVIRAFSDFKAFLYILIGGFNRVHIAVMSKEKYQPLLLVQSMSFIRFLKLTR